MLIQDSMKRCNYDGCHRAGFRGNEFGRYCGHHWWKVRGFYKKRRPSRENQEDAE